MDAEVFNSPGSELLGWSRGANAVGGAMALVVRESTLAGEAFDRGRATKGSSPEIVVAAGVLKGKWSTGAELANLRGGGKTVIKPSRSLGR